MTLEEAIRSFESTFAAVEHISQRADDLVEVVCGGVKEEGGRTPVLCIDEPTAVRTWLEAAQRYKASCPGDILVWRTTPQVDSFTFYHENYAASPEGGLEPIPLYKTYSRMAIRSRQL